MDINTALSSGVANAPKSKSSSVDNLAEPKNLPSLDRDGDKDNSVAADSVQVSNEALGLLRTDSVQGVSNQTQISNGKEAREILGRLVNDSQNNPSQFRQAFGNASAANTSRLLA